MLGLEWQGASQPGLISEVTMGRLVLENAVSVRTMMPDLNGTFATHEEESSFEKELDSSKGDDKSTIFSNGVSKRSESVTPHKRKASNHGDSLLRRGSRSSKYPRDSKHQQSLEVPSQLWLGHLISRILHLHPIHICTSSMLMRNP
ncbi:hypothetical protein CY35_02G160100 [Sphagnum magellanicum]|nr:hypothetical protein CY35_02G160100 [Sphagnum magellanicum]